MDTKPMALQGQGQKHPQEPLQGPFQQGMLPLALQPGFLGIPEQGHGTGNTESAGGSVCQGDRAGAGEGPGWVNHCGQEAPDTS